MRRLLVEGIAVKSGVSRNKHLFLPEELMNAASSLAGKPILKDHDYTVENTVGKVTHSQAIHEGNDVVMPFKGFVMDDQKGTIEKLEEGIISEVSVGAYCDQMLKETEESDVLIPHGIHFMEVSLTPTPAVDGTSIARATEKLNNMITASMKLADKPMEANTMEEKMKEAIAKAPDVPVVAETPSAVSAELKRVQEEIALLKLENAKKELEQLKAPKETPKTATAISAAENQDVKDAYEGYIVERTESGRIGIRKPAKSWAKGEVN